MTNGGKSLGQSLLPGLTARTTHGTGLDGPGQSQGISQNGGAMSSYGSRAGSGIYNGLPMGSGNTLGGSTGSGGSGRSSLPTGIGSGYQGGSPTGNINAPGGSYGLGTPGIGGGNFSGAGGGGPGTGTPSGSTGAGT